MTFQGHYNENHMTLSVPTKILLQEGKIKVKLTCNPYGCSNDGNKYTFGYWESANAQILDKNGQYDEESTFDLEFKQGPYMATKESLQNERIVNGNAGTATPSLLALPKK